MKTKTHTIRGASLKRIEELDHLGTPDWVPYTVAIEGTETSALDEAMVETQHFSGLLRSCSRFEYIMDGQIEDENGQMHDLEELLDNAAERLDQAHQEWLEAKPKRQHPDFARCDNCGTEYGTEALDFVDNLSERIHAGEEVPAGQCPDDECGALCFLIEIEA